MVPRFLVRVDLQPGLRLPLEAADSHHAITVLRLRSGATLELFDGLGGAAQARLVDDEVAARSRRQAWVEVGELLPAEPLPALELTLAQCLTSADKMDWTVEKAVELGVTRIIPVQSERSMIRLSAERAARKQQHWQEIVVAACKQCRRNRLPEVTAPMTLAALLSTPVSLAPVPAMALLLDPTASARLVDLAGGAHVLTLLVGPESGLSEHERSSALQAGYGAARLGPRVLRTETAGLAALAALQAVHGDF